MLSAHVVSMCILDLLSQRRKSIATTPNHCLKRTKLSYRSAQQHCAQHAFTSISTHQHSCAPSSHSKPRRPPDDQTFTNHHGNHCCLVMFKHPSTGTTTDRSTCIHVRTIRPAWRSRNPPSPSLWPGLCIHRRCGPGRRSADRSRCRRLLQARGGR